MTTRPDPDSTGNQTLDWDYENRLSEVTDSAGTNTFVYDPNGQRMLRATSDGITLYIDGHELTSQASIVNAKRYYAVGSMAVAVRESIGSGSLTYLLGDQLGSTTVSLDAAGISTVVQRYLPYGANRSTTGGAPVTDRGWIGQAKDGSTGLHYLNARYYDPAVGRFTAADPFADLRSPGTLDPYGYSRNNPTSLSDPSGLFGLPPYEEMFNSYYSGGGSSGGTGGSGSSGGTRSSGSSGAGGPTSTGSAPGAGGDRPEESALDTYIAQLRIYQSYAEQMCRGYGEYCAKKLWIETAAYNLSGWSNHSRFGFPDPHLLDEREIPAPVRGTTGWKEKYLDEDVNPARHVTGFLATGYFHDMRDALSSVSLSEARTRPGHSAQDQRSGNDAVNIGNLLATYPGFGIDDAITMVESTFGDASNVVDGPRVAEATSQSWWVSVACIGTRAC